MQQLEYLGHTVFALLGASTMMASPCVTMIAPAEGAAIGPHKETFYKSCSKSLSVLSRCGRNGEWAVRASDLHVLVAVGVSMTS